MKKYTGLMVLTALGVTSFLAVKAAPDERNQGRKGGDTNETQISQLDKRLNDRIVEQQDLLAMVEKLLRSDFQQKTLARDQAANTLSGKAKPPLPVIAAPAAKVTVKTVEAAWWEEYKLQMVYLSGADRYAVVNNKMYMTEQSLGKDVFVDRIQDDSIVLRLGQKYHTYSLKK